MADSGRGERKGAKCEGKLHQGVGRCTQPAGWGTEHPGWGRCKLHGGCAPNVIRAAETERLNAAARAELARLDVAPVTNPLPELQRVVGQITAWKDVCAGIVNTFKAADLRFKSKLEIEQLRSEVALWERALDRAVAALTALAKLHIQEQLIALEERKAEMVAAAFAAALAEAGLDEAATAVIRHGFSSRLKVLASEAA